MSGERAEQCSDDDLPLPLGLRPGAWDLSDAEMEAIYRNACDRTSTVAKLKCKPMSLEERGLLYKPDAWDAKAKAIIRECELNRAKRSIGIAEANWHTTHTIIDDAATMPPDFWDTATSAATMTPSRHPNVKWTIGLFDDD